MGAIRGENSVLISSDRSPHHLIGGIGDTSDDFPGDWSFPERSLPVLHLPDDSVWQERALRLASGFDTIKESFDVEVSERMAVSLEAAKQQALTYSEDGDGRELIRLGEQDFQVSARGARGVKYWLSNDDMAILIRPLKMSYPVSVWYSAAGLWEHGYARLREKAMAVLLALGEPRRRILACQPIISFLSFFLGTIVAIGGTSGDMRRCKCPGFVPKNHPFFFSQPA